MAYQVTDYISYRNYFKALATSHVDVATSTYGDFGAVQVKLKSDQTIYPLLHTEPYEAKFTDNKSENIWRQCRASFVIMQKSTLEAFDEESVDTGELPIPQIESNMEEIAMEFIAKMKADKLTKVINLDPKSFSYAPINAKFVDNCRGVRVEFTLLLKFKNCINPIKWQ